MGNWFVRMIRRNKNTLGISEVIPAETTPTTAQAAGGLLGGITGFLSAFSRKAGELIARSRSAEQATGAGALLSRFTSTAKDFKWLFLLAGAGIILYIISRR